MGTEGPKGGSTPKVLCKGGNIARGFGTASHDSNEKEVRPSHVPGSPCVDETRQKENFDPWRVW